MKPVSVEVCKKTFTLFTCCNELSRHFFSQLILLIACLIEHNMIHFVSYSVVPGLRSPVTAKVMFQNFHQCIARLVVWIDLQPVLWTKDSLKKKKKSFVDKSYTISVTLQFQLPIFTGANPSCFRVRGSVHPVCCRANTDTHIHTRIHTSQNVLKAF